MTLTQEQQETFSRCMAAIAENYCRWLSEQIQDGPGNPVWEALKSSRSEFGRGVFAPFLIFETVDEANEYAANGTQPPSAENQHAGAFIDTTCIDDFIKHTGGGFDSDRLKSEVGRLMDDMKHPWEQPVIVFVVLKFMNFMNREDGTNLTAGIDASVEWWDTEAETVPYPSVTKEKVQQLLEHHSSPVVCLSTRNPAQAGKNMNVWLDVCSEKNLTPIIDSESPDGLKHLTEDNKAKTISIPLS